MFGTICNHIKSTGKWWRRVGVANRAELGTLDPVMQATQESPLRLLSHMALLSGNLDNGERK